jgi:hypothetical protein
LHDRASVPQANNLALTPRHRRQLPQSLSPDGRRHRRLVQGRDAKKAGLKAGLKQAGLRPPIPLPNKNIENNPMQRKEPFENKGVAGMDVLPAKNILTRRANQGHIFSIPQIADRPQTTCSRKVQHEMLR